MVNASANMTYDGKPISVLSSLIAKRQKILGETVKDATIATAITVLKSLRADTKVAPKEAPDSSFKITDTGYVGGWERVAGKFHRVVRTSFAKGSPKVSGIFPVNNAGQHYEKGEVVKVYKVEPTNNPNMQWNMTKHKGCWYIFAKSESVAKEFAIRHMSRRINRYKGLAKTTLGFAMAAISTRGVYANDVKSSRALKAAQQSQKVSIQTGDGQMKVTIWDLLDYSALALKSGKNAIELAMKKAANSIAARLSKVVGAKLDNNIPIPFPETRGG